MINKDLALDKITAKISAAIEIASEAHGGDLIGFEVTLNMFADILTEKYGHNAAFIAKLFEEAAVGVRVTETLDF